MCVPQVLAERKCFTMLSNASPRKASPGKSGETPRSRVSAKARLRTPPRLWIWPINITGRAQLMTASVWPVKQGGHFTKAVRRAISSHRENKKLDALREVWSRWYDSIKDGNVRQTLGNWLSVVNRRMGPVRWEGGLVGWTQHALDDFVRAFCPSYKKETDTDA